MIIMTRKFLLPLIILLVALPAAGQEEGPLLDLEHVLRAALGTNEQIALAGEEVGKSELLRRMAWSAVIPSASFSGSVIRNDKAQTIDFTIPGMESESGGGFTITPLYDWSASLTVSQALYVGGRDLKALKLSGVNIGLSMDNLDTAKRETLLAVAASYAVVVKAQRNLEISREALDLAKRQLRQAEVLFKAGEAVRTSVLRAESGVAAAELQVISSENDLAKAKEDLAVLCGIKPPFRLKEIDQVPTLPASEVDELVEIGLSERSELRAVEKQLEMADLNIGIAAGEKLPTVFLNFNYTRQRAAFPASAFWRLILNVSVPIFDGGASTVNKATAQANYRQAVLQRQLLRKQVGAEITRAYLDLTSVRKALQSANKQVEVTRRAYEDIERFYKVGEATDLDVQDGRQQLIVAERTLANLTTDEVLAVFNLRKSLGLPVVDVR
jgi:outer membrane protein